MYLGYRGVGTVLVTREEVNMMMFCGWVWPRTTGGGWCCMSMYLVWMDSKCLGFRGLGTVLVTMEEVNMMMFCGWL